MTQSASDPDRFAARWSVRPVAPAMTAPGADLRLVRWDGVFAGPQEFPCEASGYTVIAVHENLIPEHTLLIGGREVRTGPIRPGAVQIVPAGADAGGRCGASDYHFSHLQLRRRCSPGLPSTSRCSASSSWTPHTSAPTPCWSSSRGLSAKPLQVQSAPTSSTRRNWRTSCLSTCFEVIAAIGGR